MSGQTLDSLREYCVAHDYPDEAERLDGYCGLRETQRLGSMRRWDLEAEATQRGVPGPYRFLRKEEIVAAILSSPAAA